MKNNFSFVFFGSPRFAEIFLSEILNAGYVPQAVICNPNRPIGRKKRIAPPPVKVLAEKHHIPVFQPEKLSKEIIENWSLKIDHFTYGVVGAYSKIIPQSVIDMFPQGVIGIHPSLLPKFRGATPIQSVLLVGEKETGVSLFLIDSQVDHGALISEEKIKIKESDNYASLEEKLAHLGAKIFVENIEKFLAEKLIPKAQNHEKATFTKKFTRADAFISEKELKEAKEGENTFLIARKIKAFSTEPGAWTTENEKQIKLLDCVIRENKLVLTKIQMEGKKPQELS